MRIQAEPRLADGCLAHTLRQQHWHNCQAVRSVQAGFDTRGTRRTEGSAPSSSEPRSPDAYVVVVCPPARGHIRPLLTK